MGILGGTPRFWGDFPHISGHRTDLDCKEAITVSSQLLFENEQKRRELPLWQLLCFAMFCVWQMGFIYYIGPALNIDGRTPLPISPDNLTLLIVAGYVLSILTMIFLPRTVIWLSRSATAVALAAAIGLFLPLGATALTCLIYIECFCCCYMIGFESTTMVHYFTGSSVTRHLLIAYPIAYTLIALIQSDFLSLDFSVFRILTVIMLGLLLLFYIKMPAKAGIRFVRREDGLVLPKRFLGGFMLLAFLGALLGVIAPAAAAEVEHGVFTAYIGCAVSSVALYLLARRTGKHPICFVTYIIGLSALGYVLLVISAYVPPLGLVAAALIGVGMAACALLPLFAMLVVKQYPSKLIVPSYIALAMLAVIVQSVLVEAFRTSEVLLNISYLAVVIVMAIIFVMLEPFLIYAIRRRFEEPASEPEEAPSATPAPAVQADHPLAALTKREREIVELISCGHSNADIGRILFISEDTVKTHAKSVYRKLGIHSRYELTALVNRFRNEL